MISNSMKYVLFFSFETELRYTFQFLKALEKSVNEKFKTKQEKGMSKYSKDTPCIVLQSQ